MEKTVSKANPIHTLLLALAALALTVIAVVEVSGISRTALFHKYGIGEEDSVYAALTRKKAGPVAPTTTIVFDNTHHSFGAVRNGDKVRHAYKFQNTGKHPLLITRVDASCGCTAPSYPTQPVKPGESGEIVLEFNSAQRAGHQEKTVTVHSNAQNRMLQLSFDAEVSPDRE